MTLNIEELKKLAMAATPGPWEVERLPDVFTGGPHISDGILAICGVWSDGELSHNKQNNGAFIAAANPAAVLELIEERDQILAEALQLFEHRLNWRINTFGCENSDRQYLVMAKDYPAIAKARGKQ